MAQHELVNCKKCGTLFFKTSGREICEECFKKELDVIDNIKRVVQNSEQDKIPLEDLPKITGIELADLKDLIERGRLFAILPKISLKCRFCGIELADDEKTSFTCKSCLLKFSPKVNELQRKGLDVHKYEKEARNLSRRLRGGYRVNTSSDNSRRFGFIQNYDL